MPQDLYHHEYCSKELGIKLFKYQPFLPGLVPDGWCMADSEPSVIADNGLLQGLMIPIESTPVYRSDTLITILLRYVAFLRVGPPGWVTFTPEPEDNDSEEEIDVEKLESYDIIDKSTADALATLLILQVEQAVAPEVLSWA